MLISGTVWKFPQDDIDTDQIRRSIYSHLPAAEQARHCLESINPDFAARASVGDIVVGGRNFGCGSSRPAHVAIQALGIGAVIAESFGRLFFRNCISAGLLVVPCPGIVDFASQGSVVEIDATAGFARDLASGRTLAFPPLAPFLQEMVALGGEKAYLKAWIARQSRDTQVG